MSNREKCCYVIFVGAAVLGIIWTWIDYGDDIAFRAKEEFVQKFVEYTRWEAVVFIDDMPRSYITRGEVNEPDAEVIELTHNHFIELVRKGMPILGKNPLDSLSRDSFVVGETIKHFDWLEAEVKRMQEER